MRVTSAIIKVYSTIGDMEGVCVHFTKHFIVASYARGGGKAVEHAEVTLCLYKTRKYLPYNPSRMLYVSAEVLQFPMREDKQGRGFRLEHVWTDTSLNFISKDRRHRLGSGKITVPSVPKPQ